MTSASIVKMVVPAAVVLVLGGAALVLGIAREGKLETGTVAALPPPAQPQPGVPSERALALAEVDTSAVPPAAELAGPPPVAPAPDQSTPSFDVARIEGADAVIAGTAAPGAIVDLLGDGKSLDRVVADASGQFVMVPSHLPAGSYELTLNARMPDGRVASSKQSVQVTVDDVGTGSRAEQSRAEHVLGSASQAPPSMPVAKPQESAALEPAQANSANSASNNAGSKEGAPPSAAGRKSIKVVSRGDSLWRISRITYGDGTRYAVVYQANRDRIRDPNLIHPGQILVLPTKRR
jgi:nucleoid-associated protein YgaU